jgi:hypothetical protein
VFFPGRVPLRLLRVGCVALFLRVLKLLGPTQIFLSEITIVLGGEAWNGGDGGA